MKRILKKKLGILSLITLQLCACSTLFDRDNTPPPSPLVKFTAQVFPHLIWYKKSGDGSGADYLKLTPAINQNLIFTANKDGTVRATDKISGKIVWQQYTFKTLTSGVGTNHSQIFVGTREGEVLALSQANGSLLWHSRVSSEVLASPAATDQVVLVKSIDGNLSALSANDGHLLWHYQQTEPSLILRGSSAPQIQNHSSVVGFEDGNLYKFNLVTGAINWEKTIATPNGIFPIQRMVDIDADPIIFNSRVYAATYQGNISALNLLSGQELWSNHISTYAGIAADFNQVYVSDAKSYIWAFNANNGTLAWQQTHLAARNITGPVLFGNYIVVGDAEGYLHWLSKKDGHFVARTYVNHSGILATPIIDNNILYVYTKNGYLASYSLG